MTVSNLQSSDHSLIERSAVQGTQLIDKAGMKVRHSLLSEAGRRSYSGLWLQRKSRGRERSSHPKRRHRAWLFYLERGGAAFVTAPLRLHAARLLFALGGRDWLLA